MIASLFQRIINIFSQKKQKNAKNNQSPELYIGNIEYKTKPYELRKVFEEFGDIEYLKIIRDPRTKRSKGYGFVKFHSEQDAQKAINNKHSISFRGRELKIAFAKDK